MAAPVRILTRNAARVPALSHGSAEALKWLGLALMLVDHWNKYLHHGEVHWAFAAGRVVMPLFGIVLAHNLARADEATAWRACRRMLVFGLLASPAFMAMQGRWWPLNIMFTLALSTAVIALLMRRRIVMATVLAVLGGMLVEFWWPVVGATVAAWCWWRRPSWGAALAWGVCLALLAAFYREPWDAAWALAAAPLVLLASRLDLPVPRLRWAFYAAYPLHLFALWALR
ncbi:TraX family protein [Azohydromonas aeria]|uniref:TraX family protein n=1 Tax=Azohydromonas aeria TaxID=2590212 RepID=UPI0012FAC923|nr:TraX family protein [Azohydromonas aeria]